MFGKRPLSSVTLGDLEDYKSWRRTVHKVREITLRHDLHALSLLFQYGQKHNWCRSNPVREVKIPSDQDAVRINVLSRAQEEAYFAAVESLRLKKAAAQRRAGTGPGRPGRSAPPDAAAGLPAGGTAAAAPRRCGSGARPVPGVGLAVSVASESRPAHGPVTSAFTPP